MGMAAVKVHLKGYTLEQLMVYFKGRINPPILGGIQMPKLLWWYTMVASAVTGADPGSVAAVMRNESDFRCGPIGHGTYIGPMGIKRHPYEDKFPIHDTFGNILTGARRLAQFSSLQMALLGYNKDRSPAFRGYCRDVHAGAKEARKHAIGFDYSDPAWIHAVDLGRKYLHDLEVQAALYACRRN